MYVGLYLKKPEIIEGEYPLIDENDIKKYKIESLSEALKLGQFFLDYVNEECETMTAPYEVDIIMPKQCVLLKEWIVNNKDLIKNNNLEDIFDVIYHYCTEAIELDSGIEIEL